VFALALYQRRPTCSAWRVEKRLYSRSPELVRKAIRGIYKGAFFAGLLVTGRSPFKYLRRYKGRRGMNFHNDVHDWLGGYPYESATPEEVQQRLQSLGVEPRALFPLKRAFGLFGTGCAEYVFARVLPAQG
jgi:hypothetical protein